MQGERFYQSPASSSVDLAFGPGETSPGQHDTQHEDRADEPEHGEREQDFLWDRPRLRVHAAGEPSGVRISARQRHALAGDVDNVAVPIEHFDFGPDPPTGEARRPHDWFGNGARVVGQDRRAVRRIGDQQTADNARVAGAVAGRELDVPGNEYPAADEDQRQNSKRGRNSLGHFASLEPGPAWK